MKGFLLKLLRSFEYDNLSHLASSLMPSTKYHLTALCTSMSAMGVLVNRLFGLDALAFGALLVVMVTELTSGVMAAFVRKEAFSSTKLTRFLFKMFYYLVLISVPYLMAQSFFSSGKELPAVIFDWMHVFLVVQIVLENMVSILENVSVISGKPKTHWINKIQEKVGGLLK